MSGSEKERGFRPPTAEELTRTGTPEPPRPAAPSASELLGESQSYHDPGQSSASPDAVSSAAEQSSLYPGLAGKSANRSSIYPGAPDGTAGESSIYTGGSSIYSESAGSGYAQRAPLGKRIDTAGKPLHPAEQLRQYGVDPRKLVFVFAFMLLILLTLAFCSRSSNKWIKVGTFTVPAEVVYGKKPFPGLRFIGIESTRKSKDEDLTKEMLAILESNGTPADLYGTPLDYRDDDPDPEWKKAIAVQLRLHFEPFARNPEELQTLREAAPLGDWSISSATLEKLGPLLSKYQTPRLLIRRLLADDKAVFGIEPLEVAFAPTPDARVADWLADYVMLEEYAVAQALAGNNMSDVIEALGSIFRIAELASYARSLPTRRAAAEARQKGLNILQTVIKDPLCSEEQRGLFREKLRSARETWPSDALAWEAERAYGMQVFETVRQKGLLPPLPKSREEIDRQVRRREKPKEKTEAELDAEIFERAKLSVFAIDELEMLDRRGILESVNNNLDKTIDADEVFYLRTMRSFIDACRVPFYERESAFATLREELERRFGMENEPYISELLLLGAYGAMQTLAADRAQMDAFSIALELAQSENAPAPTAINPLDGKPYTIRTTEDSIVVGFHANVPPFVVPRKKTQEQ